MEINDTTIAIYYSSRLLGFAPYSLKRNKLNQITEIQISRNLCLYSMFLVIILCALTNYGLVYDNESSHPIRMKSPTTKVVTGLDVNVVAFSCLVGTIASIFGLGRTLEVNNWLKEVDSTLASLTNKPSLDNAKTKNRMFTMMTAIYIAIFGMLTLDIWNWHRHAINVRLKDVRAATVEINVYCFMPFYVMYVMMMALHFKFAQSAYGIGRRYRYLNKALKKISSNDIALSTNSSFTKSMIGLKSKEDFIATINHGGPGRGGNYYNKINSNTDHIINQFAFTHETLGKAMVNVSEEYGFIIIFLLSSCLLHLVVTGYFFFLEILGDRDIYFTTIQMLWITFHVIRLLLIVEPCHLIAIEADKTITIVGHMMRIRRAESQYALKNFWQQLLANKAYFSACGLCKIDRQLLTSISGAIATYLVILLQFQMSE